VVEHAHLTHTDQALIGMQLDERQIPPGGTQDVRLEIADAHQRPAYFTGAQAEV
jgi:hypothetical protein